LDIRSSLPGGGRETQSGRPSGPLPCGLVPTWSAIRERLSFLAAIAGDAAVTAHSFSLNTAVSRFRPGPVGGRSVCRRRSWAIERRKCTPTAANRGVFPPPGDNQARERPL